jgi:hypothetical protein
LIDVCRASSDGRKRSFDALHSLFLFFVFDITASNLLE